MRSMRSMFVLAIVAGLTALLTVACGDKYNQSNPAAASAVGLGGAAVTSGAVSLDAKADKVAVCHLNGNGSFHVINVSGNALPSHQAHGDLVVGVDADENCQPLGGNNTPPVALDGPQVDGMPWVPTGQDDQAPSAGGDLNDLASDADGDSLTFSLVTGSLNPEGNDIVSFEFDPGTGVWSSFCIGVTSGTSSFQWQANDGQADSNVATHYFECLI